MNGVLYGTTFKGGDRGVGTVFALDPTTNVESTIYSFCSRRNCKDGEEPVAGLIDAHGALYGTTIFGGDQKGCIEPSHTRLTLRYPHDRDRQRSRCGTVFAIKHPDRNDLPGGACFYSATRADRFLFFLIAQSCDADSTCAQAGFGQAPAAGVSPSDGPKSGKKNGGGAGEGPGHDLNRFLDWHIDVAGSSKILLVRGTFSRFVRLDSNWPDALRAPPHGRRQSAPQPTNTGVSQC